MADRPSRWQLDDFLEQLDAWAARESPADDLMLIVTIWIMTRGDDPYRGVSRASGFENLWFGPVPDSDDGVGRVVTCSYWIHEAGHRVRCNSFATLGRPL